MNNTRCKPSVTVPTLKKWFTNSVRNVLGALAQGRKPQVHDVEPESQILAKQPLLDQRAQVLVGGGDNADIGLDRRRPLTVAYSPVRQHAQQAGLRFHRTSPIRRGDAALRLLDAAATLDAVETRPSMAESKTVPEPVPARTHHRQSRPWPCPGFSTKAENLAKFSDVT